MAENNSSAPLLPCPFCGGAAAVQKESPADNSGGYFVDCKSCRASTNLRYSCGDDPVPLLVAEWNARAPLKTAEGAAHQLLIALRTIAEYPITAPMMNIDAANMQRIAAQAVEAQAAPAAPDTNRLRAEILEHASNGSRLVRTLFNEPTGTLSEVEVGDWIQRAQQYLTLPLQAAPAAVVVRDEREAFEQAFIAEKLRVMGLDEDGPAVKAIRMCHLVRYGNGDYPSLEAYFAWFAWQARAALAATPALPATEDSSAGDPATESVLIEGVAYTIPEPVALELLRLHIELKQAEVQAEPVAWMRKTDITELTDSAPETDGWTPLYTAPQAQPADAPIPYLQEADQHLLHRFIETTEDDESFDIGKDAVKRLANLGVVESCGFGRYGVTMFGYWVHEHYWHQNPSLPLKTNADRDREHRAAMAAAQEGGNAAKEA